MEVLLDICLMFVVLMAVVAIVGGAVLTLSWVVPTIGELYLGLRTPPANQGAPSRSTPAIT